jgi:hypothetical protein
MLQDQVCIDYDGLALVQEVLRSSQATFDYMNSLTQEVSRRRHWHS